ncbi:MAG: alpha-amylase family glycosyl hydrolase, partial [Waterburya sp.]
MTTFSSKKSQLSEAKAQEELKTLVSESKPESDLDLDFIFTRDIEFRQETIYFIVVDRFNDGDPDNSQGSNPELYDSTQQKWGKYWGGDLQGIIDKLDYLKNLGVTAIWLTPLFEQVEGLFVESAA